MSDEPVTEALFQQCLLLNTLRAARALSRLYDGKLAPYGVTLAQFAVLMTIRFNAGRTINAVAERIAMDRSTLTRNVDLLVRRGLVVKEPAEKGNAKTCRLTPQGEALLETLIPLWHVARGEMNRRIAPHDPDEYLKVLQILSR